MQSDKRFAGLGQEILVFPTYYIYMYIPTYLYIKYSKVNCRLYVIYTRMLSTAVHREYFANNFSQTVFRKHIFARNFRILCSIPM